MTPLYVNSTFSPDLRRRRRVTPGESSRSVCYDSVVGALAVGESENQNKAKGHMEEFFADLHPTRG